MRLLITAGPTREPIDAVRFLSNRSSGRLGMALTRAAVEAGHDVTLLLGPLDAVIGDPSLPQEAHVERFESAAELQHALATHFPACDALIMAAAVADYRPKRVHEDKLPRGQPGETQMLELEPTPDLVAEISRVKQPGQRTIAFALENEQTLLKRMHEKRQAKGVDAIVGNTLAAMGSEQIAMHFHARTGDEQSGPLDKNDAAHWLLQRVARLWDEA